MKGLSRFAVAALWVAVCLDISGVAAGQGVPARQANPPQSQARDAAVPADYLIGPDDVLGIVFWKEPEMSGDVTVRPDGRITLPVIGELVAAGVAPSALQQMILKASSKYLTDANVAVVVRTINSRKVYVTGQVRTPGAHALTGPMTVLQAITVAGGLGDYADAKNITVLRNQAGKVQTFKFNYKDVSRGKNLEQNILLFPGDTVVVP
jgi:polysaccharide export outer membrane protein